MPPITTKSEMYQLLTAGKLGNTLPIWFDVARWEESPAAQLFPLWGIRSGIAGGDKRMRLNVPTDEVGALFRQWYPAGGGNISPMIDRYVVLRAEVVEEPYLCVDYVPPTAPIDLADPWRGSFRNFRQRATGSAARAILETYLWPDDYRELRETLVRYPRHVVELSACSRAVGTILMRNTVIWEVRLY